MTETLLVNFLFLLFPVLMYLIFFENRLYIYGNKLVITVLTAFSMVLCMTYPIRLELGFIFDLRYIPFIIASLYGGYKIAFPLLIILNIYRFYIGGDGIIHSLVFSMIYFAIIPYWSKRFLQSDSAKRILLAGIISLCAMLFYLSIFSLYYESLTIDFWMIVVNVLSIHVTGTVIILLLIEKIIHNVKMRERYLDTERLNISSELSASISHELRNPLTVTSGFLQLLKRSKNINTKEHEYIQYSLDELIRAEKIISDFLSFAKPQAENMVLSNLKDEVDYVNNIMIPYANFHQVHIECRFNNNLNFKYDKNQIQQCFINLYKNGIESMKNNGGTLSINVYSKESKIVIEINDTGIGMTKEEIERVGKPYYSTKDEGTGLGMLVVFSIIHKLGGKIHVNSIKNQGTTFTLTIPVTE